MRITGGHKKSHLKIPLGSTPTFSLNMKMRNVPICVQHTYYIPFPPQKKIEACAPQKKKTVHLKKGQVVTSCDSSKSSSQVGAKKFQHLLGTLGGETSSQDAVAVRKSSSDEQKSILWPRGNPKFCGSL